VSANIQVFYYTGPSTSTLLPSADALIARLSVARRQRFERRIDGAQRALDLAALRVLELAMQACGHVSFRLADVEYPFAAGISEKPRWRAGPVDFSLSHAKSIAACAVASGCQVGLDAEDRRTINPRTVSRLVPADASIVTGLDEGNALARWTRIEAVLKGAGLGVMHGREINWSDDAIVLRGQQWWLHPIDCGADHIAHVAVNTPDTRVSVQRFEHV